MGSYQASRIQTELQLKNRKLGFSAAYLAVQYLASHVQAHPDEITDQTRDALLAVGETPKFATKKQALFLYRLTFETLVEMAVSPSSLCSRTIIRELQSQALVNTGPRHRAVSEALGRLPIQFGPQPLPQVENQIKTISYPEIIQAAGMDPQQCHWKGRSLITTSASGRVLTLKFANDLDNLTTLGEEVFWMDHLHHHPPCPDTRCQLPRPVQVEGHLFFQVTHLPEDGPLPRETRHPAVAFVAHPDYYAYPNEPEMAHRSRLLEEILVRNARLLGRLAGKGIIHTALIPLFHNRVQQNRRQDQGQYRWELAGRLDQWLNSCRYPNFALSGLRDFEHMDCLPDQKGLHHAIGEHLLSFILVMGSCFRARQPELKGKDDQGNPVDSRSLFEPDRFQDWIRKVIAAYCQGMNGQVAQALDQLPYQALTQILIEKMGMDTDMEETLRIRDQEEMSPEEFHAFLRARGIEDSTVYTQGEDDIQLVTGPHLGGFNQPVSVPELIEFLFAVSGICLADRYLLELDQAQRIAG